MILLLPENGDYSFPSDDLSDSVVWAFKCIKIPVLIESFSKCQSLYFQQDHISFSCSLF